MENNKYLGKGWSFPPSFSKASGGVEMTTGSRDIDNSLQIIFDTLPGERIMRPDFGSGLRYSVFEPMSASFIGFLKDRITIAITLHENRIDLLRLDIRADDEPGSGTLLIDLDYQIRGTNSRFNKVFPYYLIEGTEITG